MKDKYTYTIIDINGYINETVATNQTMNDLIEFVNELFWDDDIDFYKSDINEIHEALLGCDYDIIQEDRGKL